MEQIKDPGDWECLGKHRERLVCCNDPDNYVHRFLINPPLISDGAKQGVLWKRSPLDDTARRIGESLANPNTEATEPSKIHQKQVKTPKIWKNPKIE